MANHVSHGALPYPIKGCRWSVQIPYLNTSGDPTDPTTPDTEISKDAGAFADCTEEVTTITGTATGTGYITLTGDETNCSFGALAAKAASGPKTTLLQFKPAVLPVFRSGTAAAGAAGSIDLDSGAPAVDDLLNGCIVRTTGGTGGGGGSGSQNNQARMITDYTGSNRRCTVVPDWETTPDSTTTFEVLLTEFALLRYVDLMLWRGIQPNALISNRLDANIQAAANDVITAAVIAANAFDEATYAADTAKYQAKVWIVDDNQGTTDRYVVIWFKNGQPITSGITSPTIQVIKVSDGTDLVASTAMTQIASLGMYRYNESTNRIVNGTAYIVKIQATIDSSTRTWYQPIGRSSV